MYSTLTESKIVTQLNIHVTPALEEKLRRSMRARGIRSKSETVRIAVDEGLERDRSGTVDFREWFGAARGEGEKLEPRVLYDVSARRTPSRWVPNRGP